MQLQAAFRNSCGPTPWRLWPRAQCAAGAVVKIGNIIVSSYVHVVVLSDYWEHLPGDCTVQKRGVALNATEALLEPAYGSLLDLPVLVFVYALILEDLYHIVRAAAVFDPVDDKLVKALASCKRFDVLLQPPLVAVDLLEELDSRLAVDALYVFLPNSTDVGGRLEQRVIQVPLPQPSVMFICGWAPTAGSCGSLGLRVYLCSFQRLLRRARCSHGRPRSKLRRSSRRWCICCPELRLRGSNKPP